ncbi:GGDEF domain-containing protein [Aliikangiella sp. IMCC44632]
MKPILFILTGLACFKLLLIALVVAQIYQVHQAEIQLAQTKTDAFKLSYELKQSSDDLTRFARLYSFTKNQDYLKNFYQVLSIRNGTSPRPKNYDSVYWDLNKPTRERLHPYQTAQSLQSKLTSIDLSELERSKIIESERQSNALVNLEEKAFNAMQGLFADENKNYTLKADPDQSLAIKLLHSNEYLAAKHNIMLPIDEFMGIVKQRIALQESGLNQQMSFWISLLTALLVSLIFLIVIAVWVVHKKVLSPIKSLKALVDEFKQTGKIANKPVFENNEVGQVAQETYVMMEIIRVNTEALRKLAYTDVLTHIHNRSYFFTIAKKLLQLALRNLQPHCLLMLDLDHFKQINDQFGHIAGDKVLSHFSRLANKEIRKADIFARYGGEEFIILLPNSKLVDAISIAEKIRNKVESTPFMLNENQITITVSIGITEVDLSLNLEENIDRADQALYRAKQQGRNILCSFDSIKANNVHKIKSENFQER